MYPLTLNNLYSNISADIFFIVMLEEARLGQNLFYRKISVYTEFPVMKEWAD